MKHYDGTKREMGEINNHHVVCMSSDLLVPRQHRENLITRKKENWKAVRSLAKNVIQFKEQDEREYQSEQNQKRPFVITKNIE